MWGHGRQILLWADFNVIVFLVCTKPKLDRLHDTVEWKRCILDNCFPLKGDIVNRIAVCHLRKTSTDVQSLWAMVHFCKLCDCKIACISKQAMSLFLKASASSSKSTLNMSVPAYLPSTFRQWSPYSQIFLRIQAWKAQNNRRVPSICPNKSSMGASLHGEIPKTAVHT